MKQFLAVIAMFLCLSGCAESSTSQPIDEGEAFAVLRFKVSGCMSCSHCRSVIRKAERGVGEGRSLSIGDQDAELRILSPGVIDVKDEVDQLLASGIIRFQIHEVEMETRGELKNDQFIVNKTGQVFHVEGQASGTQGPMDLKASVLHWENKEKLTLKLP
ncbi:MAG: hypothetical protein AB7F75_08525 [Planctomycetota bacterium]